MKYKGRNKNARKNGKVFLMRVIPLFGKILHSVMPLVFNLDKEDK